MSTISEIRARLTALDIPKESKKAIEDTKGEVADLNRERMLSGKRADGSRMPNYSPISVSVYGYPPGPIRLKNTGAFQAAIKIEVTEKVIITDSTDPKSEKLKRKYGEEIFGLDKEGKIAYAQELRPVFLGNIREKLQL